MIRNWLAAGVVSLTVGMTSTVQAASVTQPGEQVGLAYGPLPEGVYAIDTFSVGRADARNSADVGVNVPILVWSTGFKLFGATLMPVIAVPSVFVNTNNPAPFPNANVSILYNPFIGNIFAFDLGNKFSAAYLVGAYVGVGDRGSVLGATPVLPQLASTSIRNTFAASYTGEGLNLTASFTYIFMVDDAARFGGPVGAAIGPVGNADQVYLDLTATKTFGNFEIGAVAFGYTDLTVNRRNPVYTNYNRGGTFAAGGLIGYDFGRFKTQVYVTRTIADRGGPGAEETRGWFRIIAPLYTAPGRGGCAGPADAQVLRRDARPGRQGPAHGADPKPPGPRGPGGFRVPDRAFVGAEHDAIRSVLRGRARIESQGSDDTRESAIPPRPSATFAHRTISRVAGPCPASTKRVRRAHETFASAAA